MYWFFRFLTVKHIFGRFLQKDQVQNYRIFGQQQKDRETNVMSPSLDEMLFEMRGNGPRIMSDYTSDACSSALPSAGKVSSAGLSLVTRSSHLTMPTITPIEMRQKPANTAQHCH